MALCKGVGRHYSGFEPQIGPGASARADSSRKYSSKCEGWAKSILKFENLPEDHGIKLMHMGDDIAFKSGTIMPVDYMKKEYFPRLKKTIAASHKRGIKQIFHSDGNLMNILDGLVEAGIDGLHPIEVMAGMDIKEIHRRYPKLIMVGGIDVSELLPFGKPQEIRDTVKRTFEDAEGMIMMGSSTEVHNAVPLANFDAMREAIMECRY